MHRPSGVNEWQIPPKLAFPVPPAVFFRADPDEEQDTSYFALSVSMCSLCASSIFSPSFFPFQYIPFLRESQTFVRIFCVENPSCA